jgi:hypothetical protein
MPFLPHFSLKLSSQKGVDISLLLLLQKSHSFVLILLPKSHY